MQVIYKILPDRTGCTLFRSIVTARKITNLDTALMITSLSVNSTANLFFTRRTITMQIMPINSDCATTTITPNFVALGWPTPSSLETLTLQKMC